MQKPAVSDPFATTCALHWPGKATVLLIEVTVPWCKVIPVVVIEVPGDETEFNCGTGRTVAEVGQKVRAAVSATRTVRRSIAVSVGLLVSGEKSLE